MDKEELFKLFDEFLKTQPDDEKDEFWGTDREEAKYVIKRFKKFLKWKEKAQ